MNVHWSPRRKILSILVLSMTLALLPVLVSSAMAQGGPGDEGSLIRRHLARTTAQIYVLNALPDGASIQEVYVDRTELELDEELEGADAELLDWLAPVAMGFGPQPHRSVAELLVVGPGVRARTMVKLKSGQAYCAILLEKASGREELIARRLGPVMHESVIEHRCQRLAERIGGG